MHTHTLTYILHACRSCHEPNELLRVKGFGTVTPTALSLCSRFRSVTLRHSMQSVGGYG